MQQYLDLVRKVLSEGTLVENRTSVRTYATFGGQMEFDLSQGFPLLTTKQVHFRSVLVELLWFIKGDTNIKYLVDHNVRIWNEWPYQQYCQNPTNPVLTLAEFVAKIKTDAQFAALHGNLGPVYGKQWRNSQGVDQLAEVIETIKTNPSSRRMIVCSWNPGEIQNMVLPPCHCLFQFSVINNRLSCHLYQRSADLFLGVPFNIASYALLTHIIAQICGLEVGKFVHSFGDLHIYENHVEQCRIQLQREPKPLCQLVINPNVKSLADLKIEDFRIENYQSHPRLKGVVAV
ncbi:thymidylate synthase [Mycoplasmoides fastidiosum]|uniref:Thymidylate synthase n=1 Tax=Mycoplasmoides fastidiosum TaxID=92758 RepID=A0ABU0LZN0_9BACT|nr:thymidylate synthase [Mycoplasmoides fastidiosum]MDQ0514143.1 thymidylate synthase [Mycoplasmoides fastidiosum]UUD37449.1 thymidylate synthase [Mycoplasmoides fastidiosum]